MILANTVFPNIIIIVTTDLFYCFPTKHCTGFGWIYAFDLLSVRRYVQATMQTAHISEWSAAAGAIVIFQAEKGR